MRLLAVSFLAVLLVACATAERGYGPRYIVATGSKWILEKEIEIPSHSRTVYIQDGKTKTFFNIDRYQPNCYLEVKTLSDVPRRIHPDEFTVYGVKLNEYYPMGPTPTRVAHLVIMAGDSEDGDAGYHTYATEMYLRSASQPDVVRLVCQIWQDPVITWEHVTVEEMQKTLGDLFTLRIPG